MQLRAEPLPIPARGLAGAGSFPLEPDAVAQWLGRLDPLGSDADARELLRGLVHSNRLHNDAGRRRRVLACFVPPLRALHERLADTARAQPLPLAPDFERDRALAADLLREESIAFRALLVDADAPLEADARRAMQALARLAELDANAYRRTEPSVLADAHALWAWADDAGLTAGPDDPGDRSGHRGGPVGDAPPADGLATLGDHYRSILSLALVDPHRHRARQLPLLIDWLGRESHRIRIERVSGAAVALANRRSPGRWLVDPRAGAEPVAAGAFLQDGSASALVLDTAGLLREAGRRMAVLRAGATSLPGADTLERQTLARLSATLGPPTGRRATRRADDAAAELVFGVRHICARLLYGDESEAERGAGRGAGETATDEVPGDPPARPDGSAWRTVDRSATGMRLIGRGLRAGLVQVGELVTVHRTAAPPGTGEDAGPATGGDGPASPDPGARHGLLIGIVRRVRTNRDATLEVGIEFLARQAMPVAVTREDDAGAAPEQALVVACRVGGRSVQTLLVPCFLYQAGDRLRVSRRGRSRRIELARCLQVNGLFSHYAIETPG